MIYSGKTHTGKVRATNQDSLAIKMFADNFLVAVVCDGMGGARAGNVASETAIEYFLKSFEKSKVAEPSANKNDEAISAAFVSAVYDANEAVYKKAISSPEYIGMGTTLVACIIMDKKLYVANVGDSRLYMYSGKKLTQITEDHSYVQFLIDVGDITPEQAKHHPYRNRITRAIGVQPEVDGDYFKFDLEKYPDAKILLCSDGLCSQVESKQIQKILSSLKADSTSLQYEKVTDKLINAALDAGGPDNITAIVIGA